MFRACMTCSTSRLLTVLVPTCCTSSMIDHFSIVLVAIEGAAKATLREQTYTQWWDQQYLYYKKSEEREKETDCKSTKSDAFFLHTYCEKTDSHTK